MQRSFYVIVYDISNDKRRLKAAKALEALGERVQHSVFEVYLTPTELERLAARLSKLVKDPQDGVRVYDLCIACRKKARSYGVTPLTEAPKVLIV